MPEQDSQQIVRNEFLGEIKAEIVGMRHHKAKLHPGEQVNLERTSEHVHDRRAIGVENGHCEPVGYLPRKVASWLAPLIGSEQIHLDGYVPQASTTKPRWPKRAPPPCELPIIPKTEPSLGSNARVLDLAYGSWPSSRCEAHRSHSAA
jgi:hypothetical protein